MSSREKLNDEADIGSPKQKVILCKLEAIVDIWEVIRRLRLPLSDRGLLRDIE